MPCGEESSFIIGIYRSEAAAKTAVEQMKLQPGFSDHPRIVDLQTDGDDQGFHIDEYILDEKHWSGGFETKQIS